MMLPQSASHTSLRSGAHVTVVGGGPAGSLFALFALHYARQAGLDLRLTVFEPRDFTRSGPRGCNMCAGLIPVRVLGELTEIQVEVPPAVIRSRIHYYTLHTTAGQICLPQPDPDADVISVYRGQGPRYACPWSELISFDNFLLETVRSRGAVVIPEQVTTLGLGPHPTVTTTSRTVASDLVVLATGVNCHAIHFTDLAYRPPFRRQMAQTELCPGLEVVQATLGDSVHIFLPQDRTFTFAALVPKGPCISVSLLGRDLPRGTLQRFLARPEVAALLPENPNRTCRCRPFIAVGTARPLCADRFVAIGDGGITRLYKNGIGTALRTARQAAKTAVYYGISRNVFRRYYVPLCREIARDNRAGQLLFTFTPIFQRHSWLARSHLHSIVAEQNLPPSRRLHSRLLWGMFTGTYPYHQLLTMACHPRLHFRLLGHLLGELAPMRLSSVPR